MLEAALTRPRTMTEDFRAFFEAEFRPLAGLAYLMCGDWAEAEELAQDAMERTFRAWRRIRERPEAYARAVLANRHRSVLRRAVADARHRSRFAPAPREGLEASEDRALLLRLLGGLPPRQRQAVVLRYCADLPEAEVAEILGCPVGTVKSLTHRALARMREQMEVGVDEA